LGSEFLIALLDFGGLFLAARKIQFHRHELVLGVVVERLGLEHIPVLLHAGWAPVRSGEFEQNRFFEAAACVSAAS
jgi:hypothetical protein